MRGREAKAWEKKLKGVFDRIDAELEKKYGSKYSLHPARAKHGTTANPEADGLFNIGAAFSAGFGSKYGPGYVVEIRLSTMERVPDSVREQIRKEVFQLLEIRLPEVFPGRTLHVSEENGVIRIHGDLGLD